MPVPDRTRIYRTEAVVLRGHDFGEADRILTLLTPHLGKLRAIAKGVRRTKSRMSGHLDLFTRSNLLIARGRQLDIITQAESLETFRPVREDLWRSNYSHYVAELVDDFSPEHQPNYPLFALLLLTLRRISTSQDYWLSVRAFELQLLSFSGFRPQLHTCLGCESTITPQSNRFSAKMGGVLCPNCALVDSAAPPIGPNTLKLMRNLQTNEAAALQLRAVDDAVARELEARLHEYITYRLERRPRSVSVLERLRNEELRTT